MEGDLNLIWWNAKQAMRAALGWYKQHERHDFVPLIEVAILQNYYLQGEVLLLDANIEAELHKCTHRQVATDTSMTS